MSKILTFLRDEAGATAVEYGLIIGMISLVIFTAVTTVGSNLNTSFNRMATRVGS